MVALAAFAPAKCPLKRAMPRDFAHRPFPSMTITTCLGLSNNFTIKTPPCTENKKKLSLHTLYTASQWKCEILTTILLRSYLFTPSQYLHILFSCKAPSTNSYFGLIINRTSKLLPLFLCWAMRLFQGLNFVIEVSLDKQIEQSLKFE